MAEANSESIFKNINYTLKTHGYNNLEFASNRLKSDQEIVLKAIENNTSQQSSQLALDQNTINQIVSGLQQASTTGITQLHSRDIPMTTNSITQDPNIQPNYIPPVHHKNEDYINDYEETSEIINSYNKNKNIQNSLDDVYSEIQTPMLLAILYFLANSEKLTI